MLPADPVRPHAGLAVRYAGQPGADGVGHGVENRVRVGVPQVIAVSDESGNLIAFSRMDGGKASSIQIAMAKAFTAGAARNPTMFYNEHCVPGSPSFGIHVSNEGKFSIIGGGLPVYAGKDCVGGIGVSSGTPAQDVEVAEAGVKALEAHWKRKAPK